MYIKLDENKQPVGEPVSLYAIRMEHTNVSIPRNPTADQLAALGYAVFVQPEYPQVDEFSNVEQGEIVAGDSTGTFTRNYVVTDIDLDQAKAILRAKVSERRWEVETAGIMIGEERVDTSLDSQNRVSNVVANGSRMGLESVNFKKPDGTFATMTIEDVTAVANAIAYHVQACFDAEASHTNAVNALEDVAAARVYLAETLPTGWPVQ